MSIEMNINLFIREHLQKNNLLDSGMPERELSKKLVNLSENVNYYLNTQYNFYPKENVYSLSMKLIRFIEDVEEWKGFDHLELNFLTEEHIRFKSCADSINLLIQLFCEPSKDFICIFSPTFPLYQYCAMNNNILVKDINLTGNNFQFVNTDAVFTLKPKILFIPRPNNPVGSILDENNLQKLLSYSDGMIVIDEAYIEFSKVPSLIKYIKDKENLIILRSFSKSLGLAGIRSGALIASPLVVNLIDRFCVPRNFPQHTQDILSKTLKKRRKIKRAIVNIVKQREIFSGFLKKLNLVSRVYESQTNFLSAQFKNSHNVFTHLLKDHFFINDYSTMHKDMLRISIGTPKQMRLLKKSFKTLELLRREDL
jgi:histidinol-phosphate aminotransferase